MSNQPTPPTFRVLVFELWDNGKIICPAFPPIHTDQLISTQELKQIRDYVDLMIANPQNFHIVRPEPKGHLTDAQKKLLLCGTWDVEVTDINVPDGNSYPRVIPCCQMCKKKLNYIDVTNTERENKLCFDCEKKGILDAVDNYPINTGPAKICQYCQLEINRETSPRDYQLGTHNRCRPRKPTIKPEPPTYENDPVKDELM